MEHQPLTMMWLPSFPGDVMTSYSLQTALDKWQSNQTALESQYKRTMRVVNLDDLSFNCLTLADSSKLYLCVKAAHI